MFARVLPLALLLACSVPTLAQQQPASFPPNSLVVARVKLQNQDKLYAQAGQALVVVDSDAQNVLVRSTDGTSHLRVPRRAVVPIQEAAPLYDQLIKATPTDANLFLARSNVWTARGETDKAIEDIRQTLKLDPEYEAAYVSLAEALMRQEKYDEVLGVVAQAMKLDETNPTYHVLRGVALRRQDKLPEAIQAFDAALSHDPQHVPALSSRGFLYYLQGEHAKAVQDFDTWVKIEPENAMAVNNRGYNRQYTGDFQGALADYERALKLSPDFALAHQNKAWLLAAAPDDKIRDGKAAFESASKACVLRNYKVPEDLKALAAAYAELGDFQHAIEFQTRVVESKEGDAKATEQEILSAYQSNQPYRFQLKP